jgi:O-acetyl-ADP-ribose deacetylase (regulator of RNase III)
MMQDFSDYVHEDNETSVCIGRAFDTAPGNLKFNHIVHIIGPEWHGVSG